ncbi:MAG: cell envelope integrity EipB family protein [Alsobacter sp.]
MIANRRPFSTASSAGAVLILLAGPAHVALAAQPVTMASHRATYELSLADNDGGKGVEAARGRIVFEFTGSSCEGYTQNFRQVTELSGGDIGTRLSDMRSSTYEEGDGSGLRFNTETRIGQGPGEITDGFAQKQDGKVVVQIKKPKAGKLEIGPAVVFPTEQIRQLIQAGRDGNPTLSLKVFDGSEQARKVYDTFSIVGKAVAPEKDVEEPLRKAGWDKLQRWPVTISYFEEGQADSQKPLYVISFELLENGVTRALKLDYGDFGLKGELTRLDVLPSKPCDN